MGTRKQTIPQQTTRNTNMLVWTFTHNGTGDTVNLPITFASWSNEFRFWKAWSEGLITIWDLLQRAGLPFRHIKCCPYTGLTID
jgi:hypothetical protein